MKSKEERSVRAYKVSKTYSGVQALKEVSFSMKRGEVFAMLGHNGAGKSTLINIITGLIAPTHGKVYMNGLDVEEDAAEVQQIIGVCAQDDLLWDDLTAREHMLLTAAFKGIAFGEKLFNAVENVLGMVQLQDRAEDFCRQFSGGMKRRLSVAMSTVGDVDILFFDEPTTGLDPVSRRHVWNAINRMKEDRVVVLTTHNMEEADFLADTIMIMHSGKVRAFGDPLFLKQTFGKGYQVHLVVHQEAMLETRDVISHVLPVSHCQLDELSKSIAVTVPRDDVRGLPRLFSWLEKSDRAAQIIVEWGISNTTLEQVFLLLCVQNTEVNTNSAMSDANEEARRCICPMCGERQKENVFMRSRGGVMMIVPESLCWACAESNPHYIISEEDVSHALEDADHISERVALLRSQADARAETAATSAILESEDMTFLQEGEWNETLHIAGEGVAEEKADTVMSPLEEHSAVEVDEGVCKKEGTVLAEVGSEHQIIYAQMKAIIVKNVVLQGRQKCSNICSVIFVSLMFMLLYIMGLLFTEGEGVKQCSEGYLTDQDCSTATIVGHIFSGASGNMVDDYWWDDDDAVGSYGYNVKNILVPSPSGVFIFGGSNNDANYYSSYGLPYYHYRDPIIWTSMMNSTTLMDSSSLGLYILGREVPSAAESDANHYVYSKQDATYASTLSNGYPECKSYAPNTLVGTETTSTDEVVQVFSDMFADAAFVCPQCTAYPPGYVDPNRTVFFNGSFWMTNINKNYCSKQNCAKYPYGFINFISSELTNSTDYLGDDDGKCPLGIATMELNFDGGREQTMIAMTYLNLLTNLLNDPNLQTYSIQGGYSRYGDLDYDTEEVSQALSNLLTLAAMMLLNGFWPMAVWRLAHEQSLDIVLMMRTVGMKASSYIWGMFLFDMAISLVSGIAMIVFAVQLNLSQFADAPIDYMVAIVLASALSLNAMSLCIVKLLGKRSSIMPMVAPCLCVAAAAGTSLLNVFAYPNDGEWPWPLSIVPFLAQGRALYIVLVYQQGSEESDTALALLFITAGIFLLVAYVVEANIDIIAKLKKKWKKFRGKDKGRRSRASSAHTPVEISLAPFAHAEDDIATACDAAEYAHLDIDVATEKRTAMMYDPPSSIDEQQTFAIVLQKLQHVFPNGMEAVKELSMALKYGECFGLLGPNGAGKSTTISILSGTLRATRGDIYVGGANIRETTTAIHKYVGICPQFDVVWNDLTVSEHLTFQARQRGITESHIIAEVQKAAVAVGLDGDGFFTKASELSGGMRRRLSIAMSTVGNPPIIFMDEPTTGLDPDNRQAVWKIIQQLKTPNRLLLLTTHSMEEAEALCSRIGIMARGQLQCVGSAAHLKTKYGKGYVLTVNLLPGEEQSKLEELLSDFVIHQLSRGSATLLSSINRTHKYLLPTENNSVHISEVFKEMELNKEQLAIREWGLSMSTLEDVFISAVQAD